MQLTSKSLKDGDYLGREHILSADYGFGCAVATARPTCGRMTRPRAPGASQTAVIA